MEVEVKCPHCTGAIRVQFSANFGAMPGANPEIAQEVLDLRSQDLTQEKKPYNQGYTVEFEEWWSVYPLHRGKLPAFKAWCKSYAKLGANADAKAILMAGAIRYRDDPNRDATKTKMAQGWLNDERWEDEAPPTSNGSRSSIYAKLGVSE